MTNFPEMIRNVAVVGHLHHGKTALMDMLVFETHKLTWDADTPVSSLLLFLDTLLILILAGTIHGYAYPIAGTQNIDQVLPHVPCIVHHIGKITSYTLY